MDNANPPIKLVLVDDHPVVLDGLRSLFEGDAAFKVIATVSSGEEAIAAVAAERPDLVITDYKLGGMSGLDLFRKIRADFQGVKVAVLSMHDEEALVKTILKEGVNGYILKSVQQFELKNAVRLISKGYPYVSPEITRIMLSEFNQPEQKNGNLTERETEILRLMAQEYSNKQIAEKLFISERTVETHRKNIYRKTNTSSIVGLVRFALDQKLV